MKKLLLASAAALALLVPAAIAAPPAAQASGNPNHWGSVSICWNSGEGLCIWTSGATSGNNSALQNKTYSAGGIAQTWSTHSSTECGGTVTLSCPFTGGAGFLNRILLGSQIVIIENDHYGYCIGGSVSGIDSVYLTNCTGGHGEVWVMVSVTSGHWSLLSVSSANVYPGTEYEIQGIDQDGAELPFLKNCADPGCGQYEIWAAHSS